MWLGWDDAFADMCNHPGKARRLEDRLEQEIILLRVCAGTPRNLSAAAVPRRA